ncbi:MAG: hypothetical protein JWM80_4249 [Cyanobacteria bacterium RYN_339]|nr:hypothetical protein [Cyanobacteria bacterium RYN_339]
MTTRIDGPNLITPTLRNAPTQPLPAEQALLAPDQQRAAGDTAELKTGTGEMGVAVDVNLDGIHLPGETTPETKPEGAEKKEKEEEVKAGALFEKAGDKLDNKSLGKASKIANAPQVILHAIEGAEMLLHDPSKALKAIQGVIDDPLKNGMDAKETFDQIKEGAETLKETGEVVAENGKRVFKNVAEHGLAGGLKETGKELSHEFKTLKAEIKENLSHETGSGLKNIPKAIAKETAEAVEKKATKQALRALEELHPELAPKGFISKALRRAEGITGPVTKQLERATGWANKVADRVADRGVELANKSGAGKKALKLLERFNPAGGVAKEAMETAVKTGTETGTKAATKAVLETAEKAGVKLTETGTKVATEAIARTAAEEGAKVGAKVAGKGLARFAPGVNIAIAAYDTYHAGKVWADPKSTGWQKGMATATAVFSWAAATNIPIVSQVGAVLSIGTSILENIKPESIVHAAKAVGGAIADGAKAVGGAIVSGLKSLKFW